MAIETKQFNFLAVLTGIVVLGYVGVSAAAFLRSVTTWQDFSGAAGPIAGTLLGYWLRGSADSAAKP
jgi:hypothetical protein